MRLIVKKKAVDHVALDDGTYPGRCVGLVGIGEQKEEYPNKPARYVDKILFVFEVIGEARRHKSGEPYTLEKDGKAIEEPATVRMEVTRSMDKKSNMAKVMSTWFATSVDDIDEMDIGQALGAPCLLSIKKVISDSTGNEYNKIEAVAKPVKGMDIPEPIITPYGYDIEEHDQESFAALPEWIRGRIMESTQWADINSNTTPLDIKPSTVQVGNQTFDAVTGEIVSPSGRGF